MTSVLPSVVALGLAALAALLLALRRYSPPVRSSERRAASRALTVAVAVQAFHFAEEAATGFHERFPGLFDLPSLPFEGFVAFNVAWLGIWALSVPGLRSGRAPAFFAAWFLAIAGMLNAIAHPLLAVAAGGYFPGLVTSPAIGAAGVGLWLRLRGATASKPETGSPGISRTSSP